MRTLIFLSVVGFILLTSCEQANINAGEESLEGEWRITKGQYNYNFGGENGVSVDSTIEANDDLGRFVFRENTVNYDITFPHIEFAASNDSWELERSKVNEGFARVERYSLIIDDKTYSCRFGDETIDAERNATNIVLQLLVEDRIGEFEDYELELEKI